jgi:hypothetical protein
MKLYFWSKVNALADYNPGLAFAHAESKKEAIELIIESYLPIGNKNNYGEAVYNYLKKKADMLRKELLSKKPDIIKGKYGHTEMGSA